MVRINKNYLMFVPVPPPPAPQRLLLASLNGLAGLLLLQGLPTDAVKAYREALAIGELCLCYDLRQSTP